MADPVPAPAPQPAAAPAPAPVAAKPDWADERFWDKEKNELRVEDIHKSWKHANDKISGKKQAPDKYELALPDTIPKEFTEGLDDHEFVANLKTFAKENDLSQEAFSKLMTDLVSKEVEDLKAMEDLKKSEMDISLRIRGE